MKRWIEWVSILAALGAFGGFCLMAAIAIRYEHVVPGMMLPFKLSVLTFFGSLVLCFVMWVLGAWYDRVQLRRERSQWNGRKIHE